MIKVGIIGGTGYTGVELLRLLSVHSEVEVKVITSRSEKGQVVSALFPSLRNKFDLTFSEPDMTSFKQCDVIFSATPNGVLMNYARELHAAGVKMIDLAADFRLQDVALWEQWYGMKHVCPELVEQAVYGMPEVNRDAIKDATIVANPGCYVTAATLVLLPLVEKKLIQLSGIVIDAKSGVTGAGRGANVSTLYSEVTDSFKAYAVGGHRHHPEISQNLSVAAGESVGLTFVPHLAPMQRGIHATVYVDVNVDVDLKTVYHQRYVNEPFVDILPDGVFPETRSVRGSNMCRIAYCKPETGEKTVLMSVVDNLTKGAAGQAVHNMNIMFGFPEELGLDAPPIMP